VTSIGGNLSIQVNDALTSLEGLDNIDAASIEGLYIYDNVLLSTCEVQSVCNYLVDPNGEIEIHDNATGCNSQEEVEEACGVSVPETMICDGMMVYPNPVTTSTTIEYELHQPETVRITFYNQFGNQVDVIEERQQRGLNKVVWTLENLADGIYYFRLQAGEQVATGKMVLMK